jgi:hypothetical protein
MALGFEPRRSQRPLIGFAVFPYQSVDDSISRFTCMSAALCADRFRSQDRLLQTSPKRLIRHMGVDFGRRYAAMTKKLLNEASIYTALNEEGCCRMPKHVRRN